MIRKLSWTVAILACVVLAIVNVRLTNRRVEVQDEFVTLKERQEQCLSKIVELPKWKQKAKERKTELKGETRYVFSTMRKAKSLSDVKGMTGNEIVATAIRHKANDFSIFVYVPPGTHRLAYYQSDTPPEQGDRRKAKVESIDLEGESTYQIRLVAKRSDPATEGDSTFETQFIFTGPDGEIASSKIVLSDTLGVSASSGVRCYPSQLSRIRTFHHLIGYDGAIREILKNGQPRLPVEIAVAGIGTGENKETYLRFFVESDAQANLPADAIADWLSCFYTTENKGSLPTILDEVFEPYDGTGRYYFKSEFLSQCQQSSIAD